ncbi:MAG TPA: arginine deiminase family protein [Thermohalobaculum sp.]|nr:arginine deiminase family protein [Thermohalobaculum sp.]
MDETARPVSSFGTAAYGGEGWSPRVASHAEEIGGVWADCGIDSEWRRLTAVALRRPGDEIPVADVNASQYLDRLDLARAQAEHDALAEAYRTNGVTVIEVPDVARPTPNRMFCADLFVMTPEGAILARPASTVRAGEEVAVAAALAGARVPIMRTLIGQATFEGADLMWLDPETALIGRGLRTNDEAIGQIAGLMAELGCDLIAVDLPYGTMHLMGMLRIADADLAIAWPRRTPHAAVMALRERGYQVAFLPEQDEAENNKGLNFVTLGPRRVLKPAGNPRLRAFYEGLGIEVVETPMAELRKAAGAVGCLTGVVAREMADG